MIGQNIGAICVSYNILSVARMMHEHLSFKLCHPPLVFSNSSLARYDFLNRKFRSEYNWACQARCCELHGQDVSMAKGYAL